MSRWAARTFLPSVQCGFANSCYGDLVLLGGLRNAQIGEKIDGKFQILGIVGMLNDNDAFT